MNFKSANVLKMFLKFYIRTITVESMMRFDFETFCKLVFTPVGYVKTTITATITTIKQEKIIKAIRGCFKYF